MMAVNKSTSEKCKIFLLKSETRKEYLFFQTLFDIVLQVSAIAICQGNGRDINRKGKKSKHLCL